MAILNWNGTEHLGSFLQNVVDCSIDHAKVYVIDNGSTDDSMNIAEAIPEVECIYLPENYGFAKGYNLGLEQIQADLFILLNSDVEVTSNWIPPVLEYMDSANLAACQPKVLSYHEKDKFEYAGAGGGFIDKDGFVFCAGRMFDQHEVDQGQYDENREVFWASGASLFVRSDVYQSVKGLDEDFFAHMEEIDLCWRMKNRGHRIGACMQSTVYHVGGGTLNKVNPFKTFLNFRNSLFMITKNEFKKPLAYQVIRRMILDGIAGIRFLFEGNWVYTKAVLRAHGSFYKMLSKMIGKRKIEKRDLHNANLTGRYFKSVIFAYYIKKKSKFSDLDPKNFHS